MESHKERGFPGCDEHIRHSRLSRGPAIRRRARRNSGRRLHLTQVRARGHVVQGMRGSVGDLDPLDKSFAKLSGQLPRPPRSRPCAKHEGLSFERSCAAREWRSGVSKFAEVPTAAGRLANRRAGRLGLVWVIAAGPQRKFMVLNGGAGGAVASRAAKPVANAESWCPRVGPRRTFRSRAQPRGTRQDAGATRATCGELRNTVQWRKATA